MDQIHCPYCNADVSLNSEHIKTTRITCPACSDSFPNPVYDSENAVNQPQPSGISAADASETSPNAKSTNNRTAMMIFIVMGLLAVVGLSYAIYTRDFRRTNDVKAKAANPDVNQQTETKTYAPHELPLLRLLPKQCDMVVGLHAREINSTPQGKLLLQVISSQIPTQPGQDLEQFIGVKLSNIDHAVAAIRLQKESGPELFLMLRTIDPYSETAIRKAAGADDDVNALKYQNRSVYLTKPSVVNGAFWCKDEKTLVVYWRTFVVDVKKDLTAISDSPSNGLKSLSEPVRECLTKRMDAGTMVWAVGKTDNFATITGLLQMSLLTVGKSEREMLGGAIQQLNYVNENVDVFGVGARLQTELTLSGNFLAKDVPSGIDLAKKIRETVPGAKVIGPDDKATSDGPWVTVQARLADFHALVQDKMPPMPKKEKESQ